MSSLSSRLLLVVTTAVATMMTPVVTMTTDLVAMLVVRVTKFITHIFMVVGLFSDQLY